MARYNISNQLGGTAQALSTSYKTIVAATAATATLTNARIVMIDIGQDGTLNATDCQVVWDLSRQTAAGTSTAVTPTNPDAATRAAGTVGSANFTVEGTITAASSVYVTALNQRAKWTWQAVETDAGPLIPATNLAGFALRAKSSNYASTAVGSIWIVE